MKIKDSANQPMIPCFRPTDEMVSSRKLDMQTKYSANQPMIPCFRPTDEMVSSRKLEVSDAINNSLVGVCRSTLFRSLITCYFVVSCSR